MFKKLVPAFSFVCFVCVLIIGCGDGGSESGSSSTPPSFTKRDPVHTDRSPEEWLKILSGNNGLARKQAIPMVKDYGKECVDDLVKILQESKSSEVKLDVCRTLSLIGKDAEVAVPELCKQAVDKTFRYRDAAAEALGKISAKKDLTVKALTAALKDEEIMVRCMAARSLGAVRGSDAEALSALMAAMIDESTQVRAEAMDALGKIGPAAKQAVAELEEAAKSEDFTTRSAAEGALKKIRGE